ncbi:MAG: wax ester/triacylglycerol synthase family O-acyltransferase [Anaerolinea sp.]|nr:wax ester/triacylglycerol synthase family O-acyltransferase [Anaerolinea sp.]
MAKQPLSYVDAAWLHMEDPTNLMMVTGVMTFTTPLNIDHFKAVIQHRLLKYKRFRSRIVEPALPIGSPHWELDPYFDLDAHLHHIALPQPGGQSELQELVSDLMSMPLDFSKPLWHFHVVDNYQEGSALIGRLHHCIADGIALMQVLLAMTDLSANAPWPQPQAKKAKPQPGLLGRAYEMFMKPATDAFTTARQVTEWLVQEGVETISDPGHLLDLAQQGAEVALALGRMLALPPDPKTVFKGKLGVSKKAVWSRPLPLSDVKAIKNATGTTVNDVLISALAGGLRHYLLQRGESVYGLDFRAFVPVNIRKPEEIERLGNKFGLVFLALPIYIDDPLERLMEVHQRMETLKNTPEAVVAFGILAAMGMTPADVQRVIVQLFALKATAVMTNVPGPSIPLFMAGSQIEELMFWVPQSGRVGLGTSIMSYADNVYLGIVTDGGLIADPQVIIDGFYQEYNLLMARTHNIPSPDVPTTDVPTTDDLTRIKGIGPKVANLLQENAITTYTELAAADPQQLRDLLGNSSGRYRFIDPTTWPEQAQALVKS